MDGGQFFFIVIYRKNLLKPFLKNQLARQDVTSVDVEASSDIID